MQTTTILKIGLTILRITTFLKKNPLSHTHNYFSLEELIRNTLRMEWRMVHKKCKQKITKLLQQRQLTLDLYRCV